MVFTVAEKRLYGKRINSDQWAMLTSLDISNAWRVYSLTCKLSTFMLIRCNTDGINSWLAIMYLKSVIFDRFLPNMAWFTFLYGYLSNWRCCQRWVIVSIFIFCFCSIIMWWFNRTLISIVKQNTTWYMREFVCLLLVYFKTAERIYIKFDVQSLYFYRNTHSEYTHYAFHNVNFLHVTAICCRIRNKFAFVTSLKSTRPDNNFTYKHVFNLRVLSISLSSKSSYLLELEVTWLDVITIQRFLDNNIIYTFSFI